MKIIAHLDMDAFFAAIEERENPRFAGLPIIIGADPKNGLGRGVVSTANYEARKYGIHSAMPISTAWQMAKSGEKQGGKEAVFLPVNGAHYHRVSEKIMNILHKSVAIIEQSSIDEAYMDLSFTGSFSAAAVLIQKIKQQIKKKEQLTCSVGIGPNKLIAKMISARFKPDGLTVITAGKVENFLDPLPIGDIPGIGPKTEANLYNKGIYKVSDLKKVKENYLISWLGKAGGDIYKKVRGIDDSILEQEREAKSISEQETFEKDTISAAFLIVRLYSMAGRVFTRMKKEGVTGFKTITVTVRFYDFQTISKSHTIDIQSDSCVVLQKESLKLFLPFLDRRQNPKLKPIRLIGVGVENLKYNSLTI